MEGQKGLQELLDLGGPWGAVVATGKVEGKGRWLLQPSSTQAEEVRATDAQEMGGGVRVKIAAVEGVEGLVEEL